MRTTFAGLLILFFTLAAVIQDKADPNSAALQKLDERVFKADSPETKLRWDSLKQLRDDVNKRDVEVWRAIKGKDDWEKFRNDRLDLLRRSLGRFPEAPKNVKVVTTKILQGDGFTVECIIYESRPGFFVTANLYVPEKRDKPMPGFIVVHSHHNPKTQGELQDMGAIWARQGCLVLVPDMVGHGERRQHPFVDASSFPEKYEVSRQDYRWRYSTAIQLHLVGESLMGWMVWDLMRGVDVLYQRPNLDKSKLMVFGSVAGGGDPCAVFAALDPRITAAAPFNFGGPQPETKFPLPEDSELAFNYMGGGSWESTRNLRLTGRDGFMPWLIVGSLAPRGLIYGHEFAWDEQRDPVWARFNKIWGFYDAKDKLASAKGRGSVRGTAPESTHCNNIGAEHRKPIYPTLTKWFGLPIPEENKKRFTSVELQCWTDEARKTLKPKFVHELAGELADNPALVEQALMDRHLDNERRVLGISRQGKWADLLADPAAKVEIEHVKGELPKPDGDFHFDKLVVRLPGDPTFAVPMIVLRPLGKIKVPNVVIGLAQDGKAGFLKHRSETIAALIKAKVAVCLPDLRGTGETANDGRGRQSGATSYSASLMMHGQTTQGVQVQDLVLVMRALQQLGYSSQALWGDSFVEPNDPKTNFAVPLDVAKMPRQCEPMGGMLAIWGGIFGDKSVKAVYVRGGLVSCRSLLDSPYCFYPHDAAVPSTLTAEYGDLPSRVRELPHRSVRLEGLVDGLNRQVDEKRLKAVYRDAMFKRPAHNLLVLREQPSSPAEVASWLAEQVKK